MPRQSKPYYKTQQKRWVCTIKGKRITLGKTKAEATQRFHELMADQDQVATESFTLYDLSQKYLDWVKANRKPATYTHNRVYLKSFISFVGKNVKPTALRSTTVRDWAASGELNSTSQAGAIGVVVRLLNWSVEQEYIKSNPIQGIKKPPRKRRETVYTHEQWHQIRSHVSDSFGEFLDFLALTGCRPQEARQLEDRHIHKDVAILPGDEAKGEQARVIFLVPEAQKLVTGRDGIIFRNSKGDQWTANAVRCRMRRLADKVGFRTIAYGVRHSYATNALINGVDPISVAHLMGHKDVSMVSKQYSHLARNPDYLRRQATRSVDSETA